MNPCFTSLVARLTLCSLAALLVCPVAAISAATLTAIAHFNGANGRESRSDLVLGPDGLFYGTTRFGGEFGTGAVFKVTTGGSLTLISSFTGASGAEPIGCVAFGPDGHLYGTASVGGANGWGTVFRVPTNGPGAALASFVGPNGAYPFGGLSLADDGQFYGTTFSGTGSEYHGTVFKLTTAGSLTRFASLSNAPGDGAFSYAPLAQAGDGNFYGLTYGGGANGRGTIFRVTPGGVLTTLLSFTAAEGSSASSGLTPGSDGHLYGVTRFGGSAGYGSVFKLTTNGVLTTLASLGPSDGQEPSSALVQGEDGNFYGTTFSGGLANEGIVFRVTPAGTLVRLASFGAATTGSRPLGCMVFGPDGNLYGTTAYGGTSGYGTVYRLSGLAPAVVTQPVGTSVCPGATVMLSVSAFGSSPLFYQWRRGGVVIAGATNSVLALTNIAPAQEGDYSVVITNGSGSAASTIATVSVADRTPPLIACSTNVTVDCSHTSVVTTVRYTVSASDLCDPAPVVVCTPPSGSAFPMGGTTVNCTATDAVGNTNGCSFTVTVRNPAHVDTTIVSMHSGGGNGWGILGTQRPGVSWTQQKTYGDVSIAAHLSTGQAGTRGIAYLTRQIGAGTSSNSHEVARAAFTFPAIAADVTLFTGLLLTPGTYFLTLTCPVNAGNYWWMSLPPVSTNDAGATLNPSWLSAGDPNPAYPPASPFSNLGPEDHLRYTVRGVAVPPGQIWAEDVTVTESANDASFRVVLSAPQTNTVTVGLRVTEGSARSPSDFSFPGGILNFTFAPGETNKIGSVLLRPDSTPEPTEHFFLKLENPVNATLARAQATVTILDDDAPLAPTFPGVWIAPAPNTTNNLNQPVPLALRLDNPPVTFVETFSILDGASLIPFERTGWRLSEVTGSPTFDLGVQWTPTRAGEHALRAVISYYDANANFITVTSPPISLTVVPPSQTVIPLVSFRDQVWRYDASTNNLGTLWREYFFDDSLWPAAPGLFYNETTPLPETTNTFLPLTTNGARIRGFYFRTHFNFAGNSAGVTLTASNLIDDGAVFYLNGNEVGRLRMTNNPVLRTSLASGTPPGSGGDATSYEVLTFPAASLVLGDNVLAVEVHQVNDSSSDVVFGMSLTATVGFPPAFTDANQPTNRTVLQGRSTTLTAPVTVPPPVLWSWFKDGLTRVFTSTNSPEYSLTNMTAALAGQYYCVVSNQFGSIDSRVATVSYTPDGESPRLLSGVAGPALTNITVTFNEPLNPSSATNLANYTLARAGDGAPLAILRATVSGATVTLVTAPRSSCENFVLTVSRVADVAGNAVAPNSQVYVATTLTLIAADNHNWRYFQSNTDPGPGWPSPGFNDRTEWCLGPAPFDGKRPAGRLLVGPANVPVRTMLNLTNPPAAAEITRTYYFRTEFTLPGPPLPGTRLLLRSLVDDGAVFYLNGVEVRRQRMPAAPTPIGYADFASGAANDPDNIFEGPFELPVAALVEGANVLAAEVHQVNAGSSDVTFAAELGAVIPAFNPPVISQSNIVVTCSSAAGTPVTFSPIPNDTGCRPVPSVTCVPPSGSVFPIGQTLVNCTSTSGPGRQWSASFTVTVLAAVNGEDLFPISDGRDGDYMPPGTRSLPGGTYYFRDFIIPAGVRITVSGQNPLRVYTLGKIEIHGSLIANANPGGDGAAGSGDFGGPPGVAYAGGGWGGGGGSRSGGTNQPGTNGFGPGGGTGASLLPNQSIPGGGGGGGFGTSGFTGANGTCCVARCGTAENNVGGAGGAAYSSDNLANLMGGSGGGGGAASGRDNGYGAGGGGGGGAIYLEGVSVFINNGASIQVNGGPGGNVLDGSDGSAGGGGSGGLIWIRGINVTNRGSLQATGGLGGTTVVGGSCGFPGAGGNGAVGRIRLEGVTLFDNGASTPGPFTSFLNLNDTTPPTLHCTNLVATCDPSGLTVVSYGATAADFCDPAPIVVCTPPSGGLFPPGETRVHCTAEDAAGNTNACSFTITVLDNSMPPFITAQPQSRTNVLGTTATFTVVAASCAPLSYQWQQGGIAMTNGPGITGVNSATLTISNFSLAHPGNYRVVVSNAHGSVTSSVAVATLNLPPDFFRLEAVRLATGELRLSFSGEPGATYVLDRAVSLNPAAWLPIQTNVAGPSGALVFPLIPEPATNTFWRVRALR